MKNYGENWQKKLYREKFFQFFRVLSSQVKRPRSRIKLYY